MKENSVHVSETREVQIWSSLIFGGGDYLKIIGGKGNLSMFMEKNNKYILLVVDEASN